jgi:hypothetical protein
MAVMLVGADILGNITKNLQDLGFEDIYHVSGRNVTESRKAKIPTSVQCVVVFTDFVNHNTASNFKKMAKAQSLPVVFAKRSWCSLREKLTELKLYA